MLRDNSNQQKSLSITCLSGWGQKYDSLEPIFNHSYFDPFFVSSINYSQFQNIDELFAKIDSQSLNPDILIGWSLGGQLAIRLIEQQIIKPKLLILLAPPFQMVKDQHIQAAMAVKTFADFYQNFTKAPDKTLKQFAILTAMNDRNSSEIAKNLDINDKNFDKLALWLEELEVFSCFNVKFDKMPRTVFFQGAGDMIVHSSQAQYFKERIANFRLEIFKNCGHAPHLSNSEKLQEILIEEIKAIFGDDKR